MLLVYIYENEGWTVTMAEGYRPDQGAHMAGSLHMLRLAQDLNLFVNGIWQQDAGPEWRIIGQFWEHLHQDCRWGGRFNDANHVSMTWGGKS